MNQHQYAPLKVIENRVWRFYQGGGQLEQLRGRPARDSDYPEEWVGSTTEAAGTAQGTGLSLVETSDGERRVLRDVIDSDPVGYLGRRHVETYGTSPGLLVKLLDSSERLPVHVHPDRRFAREQLGSPFGKTEAWIILSVRDDVVQPHVHLGLAESVTPEQYRQWIHEQDTERLLSSLHRMAVQPGDVIFVPSGMPHAIGEGLFLAEVQEATDFSFMCEHHGYPIEVKDAYLGMTLDDGIASVDTRSRSRDEIEGYRIRPDGDAVLHGVSEPFFAVDRIRAGIERRRDVYELALIVGGEGILESDADPMPVKPGDGIVLPAALPSWRLSGDVEALVFRGPSE